MQISRLLLSNINQKLNQGRVLIIYGARRTGKTTLVNQLLNDSKVASYYFDFEDPDNRDLFENAGVDKLKSILKNFRLVIFDEAQRLRSIGQTLKLIHDHLPYLQVIATGSSSFDLSNRINEPLTGRKWEFMLFPISTQEILAEKGNIFILKNYEEYLVYGMYPDVLSASMLEKPYILKELTTSYLLKDVFLLEDVRNPEVLEKLLKLLAFQISSEVSYHEIATKLGINQETVARYTDLLEKAFVVFRLPAFSRNQRNELVKTRKIYFYDLGIRNSLIQNYNSLELRNDQRALWENFCIIERKKYLEYNQIGANLCFWRNYQQQEIDYIEEKDGILNCFEFKYNDRKKAKLPKSFQEAYPNHTFKVIDQNNLLELVG